MSETLKQFFQNFLAIEKNKAEIDEQYINFLKILWINFNEFSIKTKNQRKILILEQIERFLTDTGFQDEIKSFELLNQEEISISQNSQTPQIKLKEIDLVNFRGFQSNDDGKGRRIVFNEKATLFFSPNGGGKTSLCEALEWCLIGDTTERLNRRIEPVKSYFQNDYKNEPDFSKTNLILTDSTLNIPNHIFDRCFLEKNRIEKFAKLAIQSSSEIQEVLGELFGFSEIVDFVKEFGQDLSPTENEKNREGRENWQIWLDWNNKKIEQEKSLEIAKDDEEKAIHELNKLTGDKSFDEKNVEIEEAKKKLLSELEVIERDLSIEFSAQDFLEKIKSFFSKAAQWKKYEKDISDHAKELDFESLFQAANSIFQNEYKDNKCPLCDTPFEPSGRIFKRTGVFVDPRKKTERELKKLKKLTDWKNEKERFEIDLRGSSFRDIRDSWQRIQENLTDDNWKSITGGSDKPFIPTLNFVELESKLELAIKVFIEASELAFNKDFSNLYKVENAVLEHKKKKEETLKEKPEKEKKIQNLKEELVNLQDKKNILSAKQQIKKTNEDKLQKTIKQSDNSDIFKKFLDVYLYFFESLQKFQSSIILKEGVGIDDLITGYYSALNLYDNDNEKVKIIHLPKSIQEKFCFVYEKDEGKNCNALHILSEGHLRTLGLAALLARATKHEVSTLIFDDAINAIDSDHRDNIAFLLTGKISNQDGQVSFNDSWSRVKEYLNECQFVITTHDRFFDEKIANLFKKEQQSRYVLYSGNKGVSFCEKDTSANFEAKIDNFLKPDMLDVRSAIFYCRIWLEELVFEIVANFKKPTSKKQIDFSDVVIDKRTRSLKNPELSIVIEKLIKNLNIAGTTEDDKKISSILEDIYKEKDGNYVWFFEILNQESHYRRLDHINISHAPTSKEVEIIFKKIQEINYIYAK